jgi:protein CpxP
MKAKAVHQEQLSKYLTIAGVTHMAYCASHDQLQTGYSLLTSGAPNLSCVPIIHKENIMKRNHTIIASLILAAGLSGIAFAQGGRNMGGCDGMGPMGMGPGGQMGKQGGMKFDPAQRAERHLTMLKGQLKITPEQEPLWQTYAEKMKANAGTGMHAMRDQMADTKLTAPERMARMQTLMEEHLAKMKGVHDSFSRLYAALTPEQKVMADQHVAQMGQQGKGGKPNRSGGPGSGPGRVAAPAQG